MKIQELTQQAIEQNREAVENYINGITALQKQAEGLVEEAIGQAELIPTEGRETLQRLLRMGREYREEVSAQVQKGREELERWFPQVH